MPSYQPIACHLHDVYESAIVSRQQLELRWLENGEDGRIQQQTLLPLDLTTHNGAEWLLAKTQQGDTLTLRLDWILQTTPL